MIDSRDRDGHGTGKSKMLLLHVEWMKELAMDTDVLIVGGGPAGLAAAIHAANRGLYTTVFEHRSPPIDKACGEGLMPAAFDAFDRLGVGRNELTGVPIQGIRYLDAADRTCAAEGTFAGGEGRGVRRLELHRVLHRRAEAVGVDFQKRRASEIELEDDAAIVEGIKGRWLIGADGLHSGLRKMSGLDDPPGGPQRYGVRRHFEVPPWSRFVEVHWAAEGEAYVTPVGSETVGVAILAEQGRRFDEAISAFPALERRLAGAPVVSEDRGAGSFLQGASSVRRGRLMLVGDAAGYVDALTGEGVTLAVETAMAAIDAIADDDPGRYPSDWRRITFAYRWLTRFLVEVTRYRWTQRPLIQLLDRFPVLFDGCLHLLGGRGSPPMSTGGGAHRAAGHA